MKRRKIYYVPGMISLIFLPILCVWYLNEHKKEERSIVIFIPSSNPVHYPHTFNPNETPFKSDPFRLSCINLTREFYLTGKIKNDSLIIHSFSEEMQDIIESKDYKLKLHVIFGDNINYQTYIYLLDVCLINCKKYSTNNYFALNENELWFCYNRYLPKK